MATVSDRIEKQIVLNSPVDRVWRAISSASEFGAWFGARLDREFAPGATVPGAITVPGYEHLPLTMYIESIEPPSRFAYRWHAHAWEPDRDYTADPTTLVEFRLSEVDGGTLLTITESGFDQVPESYRVESFMRNDGGWAIQIANIERHVAAS